MACLAYRRGRFGPKPGSRFGSDQQEDFVPVKSADNKGVDNIQLFVYTLNPTADVPERELWDAWAWRRFSDVFVHAEAPFITGSG